MSIMKSQTNLYYLKYRELNKLVVLHYEDVFSYEKGVAILMIS